ncbi:MAG: recombination mediator RecR [Melioribacteraceae bacterium]|nr:recombination mediator RecR [Melioribacteraceae bacterium]MCF8355440.1 recombination mediator RecR [Melioribacteraceae bacterium]MCF8395375.1 recombination mediator RecR [Melioribacteraceae bacterium]MCF8420468.1 recombination mediator RecR [Melioribacteraceae bacterium]
MLIAEPLQRAIDELSKLPSIGRKTALRLALYLLKSEKADVELFVKSLIELKEKIKFCSICSNITVDEICDVCKSRKRDRSIICIVEEASDIIAIERTNEYNGLYHVLGGVLSPLSGKDADSLNIHKLIERVENSEVKEILVALNPDTEGETTTLYLAKLLKPFGIRISRIARGLPIGGDLEFADEATIGRAVLGRVDL